MHNRNRVGRAACLICVLLCLAPLAANAQTSGPVFSTKTPTAGFASGTFYVFVQFQNTGTTAATNVEVTSATLGGFSPLTPSFPTFHAMMLPTQASALELHFNGSEFASGQRYLLTLRGTYQVGTSSFGFAINRFVVAQDFTAADLVFLQHKESADAISAFLNSLPGIDPTADNQTLLSFIQGRPEFTASGITDSTVWAQFADGKFILTANGDRPDNPIAGPMPFSPLAAAAAPQANSPSDVCAEQSASALRVSPSASRVNPSASALGVQTPATSTGPTEGLPQSSSVLLLTALGESYPTYCLIQAQLQNFGYSTSLLPATVANLKTVGGQGVVVLTSHGAAAAFPLGVYSVLTTDPVDPQVEKTVDVAGDPTNGIAPTLGWMVVPESVMTDPLIQNSKPTNNLFYGILPQFVSTYWRNYKGGFDPSSLVIIDACDANTDKAKDFKAAVFNAGAGVYAGWTGEVNDAAALYATALTFDRLLGADAFCPEDGAASCSGGSAAGADASPPVYAQRPFDYVGVMTDLPLHAVQIDARVINPIDCPSNTCPLSASGHALQFDANPAGSTFGLLAPSIAAVFTLETSISLPSSMLVVAGTFGSQPGEVSINGQALAGCTWGSVINCPLPDSGPQAAGPVQVTVDGHMSNEAALTQWQAPWNFAVAGPGTIAQRSTFNLGFRADIRKRRLQIHVAPVEPASIAINYISTSSGTYSCRGQAQVNPSPSETDTYSWADSGMFALQRPSSTSNDFSGGIFLLDSRDLTMQLTGDVTTFCQANLHVHAVDPVTGQVTDSDNPSLQSIAWPDTQFFGTNFPISLDVDGNILPDGGHTISAPVTWSWPAGMATGAMQWSKIAPVAGSAPDPKSAR